MALFNTLRRALTTHGLIIGLARRADARTVSALFDRLREDSADGRALRHCLRPQLNADRPIIERFAGTKATLSVEGPVHVIDGVGMPLGGQIECQGQWLDCYPAEVNEIVGRLRTAIDDVLNEWSQSTRMQRRLASVPPKRMRPGDDETAIIMMTLRAPSSGNKEQAADER